MPAVFQVNPDGSITFSNVAAPSSAPRVNTGALAAISKLPQLGDMFLALDQPKGQQLYVCTIVGQWYQCLNLGGSGALTLEGGSLDVNLAIVPLLESENTFTGLNHFKGDVDFTGKITGVAGGAAKLWVSAKSALAQPVAAKLDATLGFETLLTGSAPGIQTSPSQFTIPVAGIYRGYAQFRSIPAVMGAVYLSIRRNGQEIAFNGWAGGTLGGPALQTVFSLPFLKGDILMAVASSWTAFTIDGAVFVLESA